jgi:ribonucleoside-triphosphate reductase
VRRVTLVRRRDGETIPFDESRVVEAVERALDAAGRSDPRLAAEIAGVVGLFLEKTFHDEVPSIEQVEDMVEKVLVETGHAEAARAFILQRERQARLRAARETRDGYAEPTLFDPRVLLVDDGVTGTSAPFAREALARVLAADGLLPRQAADEVAAAVEERLRRAGVSRAPASLVRGIAEAELLGRDAPVDLRRRGGALLPREALETAMLRRAPRTQPAESVPTPACASAELGSAAMRSHALADLLPAEVARAHLDGDLHVHGLGLPGALFCGSFSAQDVRAGRAPGGVWRSPEETAISPRRLATAIGRGARVLADCVTGAAAVAGACAALPPSSALAADGPAEDAWHLVAETSADPGRRRVELDITPDGSEPSAASSAAVLRACARGAGLPPREALPVLVVAVSERTLEGAPGRTVLRLAAEAALRGDRVVFPLLRDDSGVGGTSACRGPAGQGNAPSRLCAGRVTLNLPRAARRAGRGNVDGFLRECDRLVDLATQAHRARRGLLCFVATAPGGPLAGMFRAGRGRAALYDLGAAAWSFAVTGLNEALVHVTGFELHEGGASGEDAARGAAKRIMGYLAVRVKAAGLAADLGVTLDADDDPAVARRFLVLDRRREPDRTAQTFPSLPAYTPGVGVRADAPIDLLLRIEREDPLHAVLSTATLHLPLAARDSGGPDGVVALLAKCLRVGGAVQAEFTTWS